MEEYLYSILFIVGGIVTLYITFKDRKSIRKSLDVTYVSHLKGYVGGFGLILIGVIMLYRILF